MITNTDIEKHIKEQGKLTYRNVGYSMMPLLKEGRDIFTIEKADPNKLKKYDVVLYKVKDNRYVLHRIIKINNDMLVIRGDNTFTKEYVNRYSVIAVMTSFVHKGKTYHCDDKLYKRYSSFWNNIYLFRKAYTNIKKYPYIIYGVIKRKFK